MSMIRPVAADGDLATLECLLEDTAFVVRYVDLPPIEGNFVVGAVSVTFYYFS